MLAAVGSDLDFRWRDARHHQCLHFVTARRASTPNEHGNIAVFLAFRRDSRRVCLLPCLFAESAMLRIITERSGDAYRLELHGRITGDWIAVLERQWREIRDAAPSALVRVGLSNVVFIDADGEQLLRRMAQSGVQFDGAGVMNRYVIEKVSGGV
jgi:hypothetical protein